MKALELMLCDWVINRGVKVRVVDLDSYMNLIETEVTDKYDTGERVKEVDPIPLTDEFFEANGFKYDKACLYWYKEIEKGLWLTICVWFHKLYKIEIIRGQYSYDGTHEKEVRVNTEPNVHLLQHALRLCGLEEIANNLKVE